MKAVRKWQLFLTLSSLFIMQSSYAWWEAGHMIVANIAYSNLNSQAKRVVKEILPYMAHENTLAHTYDYNQAHPNYTMMALSTWPDDIHSFPNYDGSTRTWHYIEHAYSTDGTGYPALIPRDNVVWAIGEMKRLVALKKSNQNARVRALAYLIHFVGDIHQPLHCTELHTKSLPNGDRGGNSFSIYHKEPNGDVLKNLHALWDSGVQLFPNKNYPHNVNAPKDVHDLSLLITKDYPKSYFTEQVKVLDPSVWEEESHQLGIDAHNTPIGAKPSNAYLMAATDTVEKQIALAGYRLANLLNEILN